MMVGMPIGMHVRRADVVVNVNDPHAMLVLEQTRGSEGTVGKSKRERGRQDAKEVDQGDEPPCPHPPSSLQAQQHRIPNIPASKNRDLIRKHPLRQPVFGWRVPRPSILTESARLSDGIGGLRTLSPQHVVCSREGSKGSCRIGHRASKRPIQ
jgi:hypothetical protein